MLENYLKNRLKEQDILLMTHIVIGYPTFDESLKIVEAMVQAGVDLMELQIPFSEPIADGPVILRANQMALEGGASVLKCLDFAETVAKRYPIPFLIMTYYNILFKFGVERFVSEMSRRGLKGAIVPDLPPEEGRDYLKAMKRHQLDPIFIFSPTSSNRRMNYISGFASGLVYCVARKGVTGADTTFSSQMDHYLKRCRSATSLPLALGFGVKDKADVDFLKGRSDIAVIGTQTIRLVDEKGAGAVKDFIEALR